MFLLSTGKYWHKIWEGWFQMSLWETERGSNVAEETDCPMIAKINSPAALHGHVPNLIDFISKRNICAILPK